MFTANQFLTAYLNCFTIASIKPQKHSVLVKICNKWLEKAVIRRLFAIKQPLQNRVPRVRSLLPLPKQQVSLLRCLLFFVCAKKTAQGTRRVPGVIDERCLRQIQRGDNGAAVGGKTTLPGSFSPDTARMVVKRPLFLFIIKISSERESVLWAVWDFYPNLFLKPF